MAHPAHPDRDRRSEAPDQEMSVLKAGGYPLWTALGIVFGTLVLASQGFGLNGGANPLLPFLATLVGVSLYMMGATKSYKEKFRYRYLPDYCYRIAQSVVYTYAVLAIMAQSNLGVTRTDHSTDTPASSAPSPNPVAPETASPEGPPSTLPAPTAPPQSPGPTSTPSATTSASPTDEASPSGSGSASGKEESTVKDFSRWPPNLIGLLIGLFILHVEKAMEGFGERFGEALTAILGRSLEGKTPREKQMDRIRDEKKLEEIRQQAELIASQAPGRAVLEGFQKRLADVTDTVREGEPNAIHDDVVKLAWEFEQLKVALREETSTVAEILGHAKPRTAEKK